ncbi:MAG: hypothetical protein WBB45_11045 [Cyclobacteriaceae bacterium]
MRKLFTLMVLPLFVFMAACSTDSEDVTPSNEIVDSKGVEISLEWSTGGSTSQSLNEVDLDLYLFKDANEISSSETGSSFEDVAINAVYADGEYDVDVEFYSGTTGATFTVFVTGIETQTSIEYTGSFDASEAGNTVWPDFIKVTKTGDTYTVSKQ